MYPPQGQLNGPNTFVSLRRGKGRGSGVALRCGVMQFDCWLRLARALINIHSHLIFIEGINTAFEK